MADEDPMLNDFLQKVDEIGGLVKNLSNAKDSDDHQDAIQEADTFLANLKTDLWKRDEEKAKKYTPRDKTGVNRSVINQKAFQQQDVGDQAVCDAGPELHDGISQEAFMSVIEQDAKKRAARKEKKRREANVVKERGNEEFKNGNYQEAISRYTEALSIIKDITALWTNRAQAYIKLEQYTEAISDCDWALRVSEKCIKAYVHKSKALAALHRYEEALSCLKEALEQEPSKEVVLSEYIAEVELQQRSHEDEKKAKEAFDTGSAKSQGIVGILDTVNKNTDCPARYYSGGLRLLKQVMKDTNERTLFRTHGGLMLTQNHPYISRCFSASPQSLSQDEVDMCAAMMEVLEAACVDNEENQRLFLEIGGLPDQLLRFLECKRKSTRSLKQVTVRLLHWLSERDGTRSKVVRKYGTARLLTTLFELNRARNQTTAATSVGLMNNLALDKNFKSQLRDKIEDVLPAFEVLMKDATGRQLVLPSCVSTVTNLCGDSVIRQKLLERKETWEACCVALEHHTRSRPRHEDAVFSLLGLLQNLTLEASDNLRSFAVRLCGTCAPLAFAEDGSVRLSECSCRVLGHLLPHTAEGVELVCRGGQFVPRLLDVMQIADTVKLKAQIKMLTACTQHHGTSREEVLETPRGLELLSGLLKHEDEHIVGNAALCLSHCSELPCVAAALADTNVVMDALVLARDARNAAARQNCAILIAKLTQNHSKHLERLRELDGLGILHNVMKTVKD